MKKTIALVAHDSCKKELLAWVSENITKLEGHDFYATGTTGRIVSEVLKGVKCLKSGPLGGDQQLGSLISDEKIDYVIFFWDPMTNQPHDVDVKALLRLSVLYNVPTACNRATADFLITSTLFADKNYQPETTNYSDYLNRKL
ncbi:MAG: methylglyoxal synthase [Lentimicrobiaceae bacterium]|jgi:methylglyoxal synthase|nr:methylglyoxal synthase [Lentimicrobiaceae bacterium]